MSIWTETDATILARVGRDAPPRPAAARPGKGAWKPARPHLRLEEYFDGRTQAWGIFQDRFGTLRRQFTVEIHGAWDGNRLRLTEDFAYDDGAAERRVWTLVPDGPDGYRGTADDVIGEAAGTLAGNVFRWRYRFSLALGARRLAVGFDDVMVLQPDGKLINRAKVCKLGLLLGEATIVFAKP